MLDIVNAICGPAATNAPTMRLSLATDALQRVANDGQRLWGGRLPQMISYVMDAESKVPPSSYCDDCDIRLCALSKNNPTCAHCSEYPCDKIVHLKPGAFEIRLL